MISRRCVSNAQCILFDLSTNLPALAAWVQAAVVSKSHSLGQWESMHKFEFYITNCHIVKANSYMMHQLIGPVSVRQTYGPKLVKILPITNVAICPLVRGHFDDSTLWQHWVNITSQEINKENIIKTTLLPVCDSLKWPLTSVIWLHL